MDWPPKQKVFSIVSVPVGYVEGGGGFPTDALEIGNYVFLILDRSFTSFHFRYFG